MKTASKSNKKSKKSAPKGHGKDVKGVSENEETLNSVSKNHEKAGVNAPETLKRDTRGVLRSHRINIISVLQSYKIDMRNVFRIYKRDMKSILTNYVTFIIILAIAFLPALYAWVNIQAGWDPYSKTKGLLVAVVNLDKGSEFRNVKVNVGDDVIKELQNNQSIGWTFVSESEAEKGIKYGKYYASLTIPKEFSQDLLSIVTRDEPIKAQLIYTVNEKRNAIAPKITGKGATALQEEITKNFIQTASGTVFSYLNQFGVELEKSKPQLKSIIDMVINIDDQMPEIGKSIDNVYEGTTAFQKYLQSIQKDTPVMSDAVDNALGIAKTNNEFIGKAGNSFQTVSPIVKGDLAVLKNIADNAESSLTQAQGLQASNNASLKTVLVNASNKYSDGIQKVDNIISLNKSINNFLNSNIIAKFIYDLSSVRNQMVNQKNDVNAMISDLDHGNQVLTSDINNAIQGANKTSGLISDSMDKFDRETGPAIDDAMKNVSGLSKDAEIMLQNIQGNMPLVNSLVKQTNTQTDSMVKNLQKVKDTFPKAEQDIHSNSEKLRTLTNDKNFNEVIKLLKKNGKKESDFLANPIDLKQNRVYPIPNYGSAMAPFYTTLAIWVGSFIMLSLLSVHVKDFKDGIPPNTREKFLGRYFTFISIAIMQALVTIAGNLFLLKTYVVSPMIYTLFGVYVSIVFITIIYTLVSVLGNVGKALVMVAMVLQVSASGGTFPIELLGKFFQYINPMMPFTYAIGGMREAIAGIIPEVLIVDMLILAMYLIISLTLGICFKERINKLSQNFVRQFSESGLAGE